nr:MAG TPA: hypothetical protein [Caudoviricetes sp.]
MDKRLKSRYNVSISRFSVSKRNKKQENDAKQKGVDECETILRVS